ncbi:MAG TPA: ATP-binding protein [Gammaproteobacteria bacterium]|nr:ATP-binding protein [Gammaproteobacteria bacterium]
MALYSKNKEIVFDALFKHSENIIICLDNTASIIEFNESAEKTFEITKDLVIYKDFFVFYRRYGVDCPIQEWPPRTITKINPLLLNQKLIEWTIIPFFDDKEKFAGSLILGKALIDHEAERNAKNNVMRYLNAVMNNIPHFIFWKNAQSVFLGCNRQFAEACGFRSVEDVVGKTDLDMPWAKDQGSNYMTDDKLVMYTEKALLNYEEKQRQQNGTEKIMLVSKVPMFDDNQQITGIFCIYTDITQRKNMEKELQLAKEHAEVANKAKSEFIAVASHELRIPLTGILGMIEFLKDDHLTSDEKNEYISNLSKSSKHLLSLINDILDFSKLDAEQFELNPTDLNLKSLVEEIILMMKAVATLKNLELILHYSPDTPSLVIADGRAIRQILTNLIGNAIKFTDKGFVRLIVKSTSRIGSKVQIVFLIEDTGIGIPADKQEIIFEHFQQISSVYTRNSSQEGTGLGLAITKKLVELMQGELGVKSELGRGSTFKCVLPLHLQHHSLLDDDKNLNGQKPTQLSDPDSILVLLVEDDPMIQLIHKRYIKQLGCELTIAETGKQAIAYAADGYDLILMDVGIPEISGFEATSIIREREKNSPHKTRIIGLTGYSDDESREKCLVAGMDDVLIKPVMPEEIKKIIDEAKANALKRVKEGGSFDTDALN